MDYRGKLLIHLKVKKMDKSGIEPETSSTVVIFDHANEAR
jgi:hypothetical protein